MLEQVVVGYAAVVHVVGSGGGVAGAAAYGVVAVWK